jgi:hypothetical protein
MITARVKTLKSSAFSCGGCHRYISEGAVVHILDGQVCCDYCGCADEAARIDRSDLDTVTVCKRIKAALKARSGKDWSVTKGKGTAGGWIGISAPKARLGCARLHDFGWQTSECAACGLHRNYGYTLDTETERRAFDLSCAAHACTDACYRAYITPEDRAELAALLRLDTVYTQGVSIMASTDAYIEYIDRAEGREPRTGGVQYWD